MSPKIFPTIILILQFLAGVDYIPSNWRMSVYWFAAAILSYVVTW
jgi:hypothetical protein